MYKIFTIRLNKKRYLSIGWEKWFKKLPKKMHLQINFVRIKMLPNGI